MVALQKKHYMNGIYYNALKPFDIQVNRTHNDFFELVKKAYLALI